VEKTEGVTVGGETLMAQQKLGDGSRRRAAAEAALYTQDAVLRHTPKQSKAAWPRNTRQPPAFGSCWNNHREKPKPTCHLLL